jgi:hypothetical protein
MSAENIPAPTVEFAENHLLVFHGILDEYVEDYAKVHGRAKLVKDAVAAITERMGADAPGGNITAVCKRVTSIST